MPRGTAFGSRDNYYSAAARKGETEAAKIISTLRCFVYRVTLELKPVSDGHGSQHNPLYRGVGTKEMPVKKKITGTFQGLRHGVTLEQRQHTLPAQQASMVVRYLLGHHPLHPLKQVGAGKQHKDCRRLYPPPVMPHLGVYVLKRDCCTQANSGPIKQLPAGSQTQPAEKEPAGISRVELLTCSLYFVQDLGHIGWVFSTAAYIQHIVAYGSGGRRGGNETPRAAWLQPSTPRAEVHSSRPASGAPHHPPRVCRDSSGGSIFPFFHPASCHLPQQVLPGCRYAVQFASIRPRLHVAFLNDKRVAGPSSEHAPWHRRFFPWQHYAWKLEQFDSSRP